MKLVRVVLVSVLLVLSVTATSIGARAGNSVAPSNGSSCLPAPSNASGSTGALTLADNAFGFSLFDALFARQTEGNVFLSPTSVSLALQMAYNGARGATQTAMARVLHLTGAGPRSVRRAAAALLTTLRAASGDEGLAVANSLWMRAGVPFHQQFLADARRDFNARVSTLDFTSPSAVHTINSWVSCATHAKIPTIVDRIPPNVIMYLINAVYFHGAWAHPFSSTATRMQPFTRGDATRTTVQMMTTTGDFPYYQGPDYQAIRLPYHIGRFSMTIVLPRASETLSGLGQQLSNSRWQSWTSHLVMENGSVSLPRFSLSNDWQLNGPLAGLGMGTAFSNAANFSGICLGGCKLSTVRHKTFLSVDEKGTTAAAATSVGISPTAIQVTRFAMVVNRPFFVSIEDATTGAVLFFGAVNSPK